MTSRRAVLSLFLLLLYCVMKFNACHTDLSLTRTFYEAMTPNATSRTHSVSLYLEASSDIVLSMIHKFDSLNHKAKRSVCKLCRLSSNKENSYYNISPLTTIFLLLMKSGDVSPNPGPPEQKRTYNPKHPCSHCGKGVTGRSRAISCDSCDQWTHNKFVGVLSNDAYDELCSSGGEFTHLCNQCTLHALPFADDNDHPAWPAIITQGNDLLSEIVEDAADQATTERPLDFECLHSKGLNFIHLNMRSLLPKLDELQILAANTKVAVIGITESWLEINITDYSILRRDRNHEGGDVCIYIRKDFIFKLRDDIRTTLETVWAELYLPKTRPILIGVCYRPPNHTDFFNVLERCCLDCNCFTNKEVIMMGDFNVDYSQLHSHTNPLHVSLKHYMSMFGMTQIINTSTRITSTTSTILDLILISDLAKISQCGVLDIGLSDHQIIHCTRKCKKIPINRHNSVTLRSVKNYCKEIFEEKLHEVDWHLADCPRFKLCTRGFLSFKI